MISEQRDASQYAEPADNGIDNPAPSNESTKTQDLTKAREEGFDPNEGQQ